MKRPTDDASTLSIQGWKCYEKGKAAQAKSLLVRALSLLEQFESPYSATVVAVANRLGQIHESRHEYAEAEKYFERSVRALEGTVGTERVQRLHIESLCHLGRLRGIQSRIAEAEELLEEALGMARKLGHQDPAMAVVQNEQAVLYGRMGRFEDARPRFYRALRIWEAVFNSDHSFIATIYRNLAELEYASGRYDKGERFAKRAVLIRMKVLGPGHSVLAGDLIALSSLVAAQGKFQEALRLAMRALATLQQATEPCCGEIARAYSHLAWIHQLRGQIREAEWFYWQSLTMMGKLFGYQHADTFATATHLASLYQSQGRSEDAKALYERTHHSAAIA